MMLSKVLDGGRRYQARQSTFFTGTKTEARIRSIFDDQQETVIKKVCSIGFARE